MKYYLSVLCLFLLFMVNNSAKAQETESSKFALEVRGGINYSDMNYGTEYLRGLLPTDDYTTYTVIGEGTDGYSLGIGGSWMINNRFEGVVNLDYVRFSYKGTSTVVDELLNPQSSNPRPEVPILLASVIDYSYLNMEIGIRYSFSEDLTKGLFAGASISNMLHLNTDWSDFRVWYEDRRFSANEDFTDSQDGLAFNDLLFLGLNVGYKYKITDRLSIVPLIDFRYGLNSVAETTESIPSPLVINFQAQAIWNF